MFRAPATFTVRNHRWGLKVTSQAFPAAFGGKEKKKLYWLDNREGSPAGVIRSEILKNSEEPTDWETLETFERNLSLFYY